VAAGAEGDARPDPDEEIIGFGRDRSIGRGQQDAPADPYGAVERGFEEGAAVLVRVSQFAFGHQIMDGGPDALPGNRHLPGQLI
jgi:hypothetical protein